MDILTYGLLLGISILFGILQLYDRLFGIVGILIAFIGGLYILSEGTLITNNTTYVVSTGMYISNALPQNEASLLIILLGLTAVINTLILIRLS